MIAQFDGFEINPVHNGDAWKICDLCVANADRFKTYFPKTWWVDLAWKWKRQRGVSFQSQGTELQ